MNVNQSPRRLLGLPLKEGLKLWWSIPYTASLYVGVDRDDSLRAFAWRNRLVKQCCRRDSGLQRWQRCKRRCYLLDAIAGKESLARYVVSLLKTPSHRKSIIHLANWNCEIVAQKLGFSDWIKGEVVSSRSISNPDRITPT